MHKEIDMQLPSSWKYLFESLTHNAFLMNQLEIVLLVISPCVNGQFYIDCAQSFAWFFKKDYYFDKLLGSLVHKKFTVHKNSILDVAENIIDRNIHIKTSLIVKSHIIWSYFLFSHTAFKM